MTNTAIWFNPDGESNHPSQLLHTLRHTKGYKNSCELIEVTSLEDLRQQLQLHEDAAVIVSGGIIHQHTEAVKQAKNIASGHAIYAADYAAESSMTSADTSLVGASNPNIIKTVFGSR